MVISEEQVKFGMRVDVTHAYEFYFTMNYILKYGFFVKL
jgi:hypothetical protein